MSVMGLSVLVANACIGACGILRLAISFPAAFVTAANAHTAAWRIWGHKENLSAVHKSAYKWFPESLPSSSSSNSSQQVFLVWWFN
jgi:hypothetical protein